ncbi:MAG TPA: MarR family transcriptional regulator [Microlunatus sp.]|nr:MarR family transcriptional regulator [Microlunatus sp.]
MSAETAEHDEADEASRRDAADGFVERFATAMVHSGMPRMPARVFAHLLSQDSGAATAAELTERLQASPAAISGAVRYLIQVRLVARSHRPGERRDVYQLFSDHWYEMLGNRDAELGEWSALGREGAATLGRDTPAGRRLDETAHFFDFLRTELADVLTRWRREIREY